MKRHNRKRQRFGAIVVSAVLVSFFVIRCGGDNGSGGVETLSPNGAWNQVRKASDVQAYGSGYCRVTDAITYQPTTQSNLKLWVRGGGWEDAEVLTSFASQVPANRYIAIVLSATSPSGQYNSNYFLKYYRDRISGVMLKPVFTQGNDANSESKAQVLRDAGGIIITGGQSDRLRHLPGTLVGNEIKLAYRRGVPIYTNSASASLVGSYFGWDLTRVKMGYGLALVRPTFVSHLEDPKTYRQGIQDLWSVVPQFSQQSFGLTAGTLAVIHGTTLEVYGADPARQMVYVYDSRLPQTKQCRAWVLFPGEKFGVGF